MFGTLITLIRYLASASASGPPPYLKHPMTLLHRRPDVFGFREPLAYTYPPRQDMEYWSAGTKRSDQTARPTSSDRREPDCSFYRRPHRATVVADWGRAHHFVHEPGCARRFNNILRSWPLLVPGVAAPCLYLLVSVEPRYVAPFLVLVLLGLFPGILLQIPKGRCQTNCHRRRWSSPPL